MLKYFDSDGDGCLNREEFLRLWETAWDEDVMPPDEDDTMPDGDDVIPPAPTPDEEEDEDEDIPDDETPQEAFDRWVRTQKIPKTDYYCYLDIATTWENGYNFFAGHDCKIYDLKLSVMAKKRDWDDHKIRYNSKAMPIGDCQDIGVYDRLCNFMLTPDNNKLGIQFDPEADVDLYYETEWTHCVDGTLVDY